VNRTCRAPGCSGEAGRYGRFCATHKARSRRHGEPEQRGVTVAELAPYLRRIRGRIARNADSPVWAICDARWEMVVENAEATLRQFNGGASGFRCERLAAQQVVKVAAEVAPRDVVTTTAALYLLQADHPHRFLSDKAFWFQLGRRVRGLASGNVRSWAQPDGSIRKAYVELSPRAAECFAHWTAKALGPIGLHLARLEQQERDAVDQQRQELADALRTIR
jgi:hypothetical protein